ncbi:uncharacterized protein alms1 isoform X2 [Denticeps clupeoides]|uniref:uncharacterized protein alms1 isoform X2 n=1 Tax=Denticeps clupeoides TaxID=299321 RepID=UPI0010A38F20|nr:Alstrom syndrome protein 1 isoform X2 [Denticeps clupeoides]
MDRREPAEDGATNKTLETWYQLPAEEERSQLPAVEVLQDGASTSQVDAGATSVPEWRQPRLHDSSQSMQLEFQDSQLSPALTLLPAKDGKQFNFSEYTLLQKTDLDFAPLRGSPDFSVMSERLSMLQTGEMSRHHPQSPAHDNTTDQTSLSQHPLVEDEDSNNSLSQHSLSPCEQTKRMSEDERVGEEIRLLKDMAEDDGSFLSSTVPASALLELLEKEVGVISSSSAVSSTSETVFSQPSQNQTGNGHRKSASSDKQTEAMQYLSDSAKINTSSSSQVQVGSEILPQLKPSGNQSGIRKSPQGGQMSKQQSRPSTQGNSQASRLSDISNITLRSSGCRPDAESDALRSQLLLESRRSPGRGSPTEGVVRLATTPLVSVEHGHKDQALWHFGLQTGVGGSFLSSNPMCQSTPAVLQDHGRGRGHSRHPAKVTVLPADTPRALPSLGLSDSGGGLAGLTGSEVDALPSLSYLQKVDAWQANKSSSSSGAFSDEPVLQGCKGSVHGTGSTAKLCTPAAGYKVRSQSPPEISSVPREDLGADGSTEGSVAVAVAVGGGVSPLVRTHSHSSSVSTVITSIQHQTEVNPENVSKNAQLATVDKTTRKKEVDAMDRAEPPGQSRQTSHFISLGHFSDVSSTYDTSQTLSSSHDSVRDEGSVRASLGGASSAVSLEVDNYAPYWVSTPPTPIKDRELNIEDRIPNLGINQSPSTILAPFIARGPIREPEFSPTELVTIKGSIGTPTKSTLPSEVSDSPEKGEFSLQSQNSSVSLPISTARPIMHLPSQESPACQESFGMALRVSQTPPEFHDVPATAHSLESGHLPYKGTQHAKEVLASQKSSKTEGLAGDWPMSIQADEIQQPLGQKEGMLSLRSSLTASTDSDTSLLLSLKRKIDTFQGDSLSSSQHWEQSSSDSISYSDAVEVPETTSAVTKEHSAVPETKEACLKPHDVRRAEPEGCSATDPDKAGILPLPLVPVSAPPLVAELPEGMEPESDNELIGSVASGPPSIHVEEELGSLSDSGSSRSSQSSLAVRVATLLQDASPVSVITSRPSTADQEESRAREWILLKASGQKCEPLHLSLEDRQRIEEIKKELLMQTKSQNSTDSDGSGQSVGVMAPASVPTESFAALRRAEAHLSDQLNRISRASFESRVPHITPQLNLESHVHEVAPRESLSLACRINPLTSITTADYTSSPPPQHHQQADNTNMTREKLKVTHFFTHSGSHPGAEDSASINAHSFTRSVEEDGKTPDPTVPGSSNVGVQHYGVTEPSGSSVSKQFHLSLSNCASLPKLKPPQMDLGARLQTSLQKKNETSINKSLETNEIPAADWSVVGSVLESRSLQDISAQLTNKPPRQSTTVTKRPEDPIRPAYEPSVSNQIHVHQEQPEEEHGVQTSSRYPQSFTPPQNLMGPLRHLHVSSHVAAPTLLPYKPHGSSELFYIPQTDIQLSTNRSDTTMESSHTGSDDAVPPQFTEEILGSRDFEDDLTLPKHREGIYSKTRGSAPCLKTARPSLAERGVSLARMSTGSLNGQSNVGGEREEEQFKPLQMEADFSVDDISFHTSSVYGLPPTTQHAQAERFSQSIAELTEGAGPDDDGQDIRLRERSPQVISSSLDQLWHQFSERCSLDETRPSNERESSLLERLERLSRLINSSSLTRTTTSHTIQQSRAKVLKKKDLNGVEREKEWKEKMGKTPRQAWEEPELPVSNKTSKEEKHEHMQRSPAERDSISTETSISTDASGSLSTIDTERLLRAFGPERVNVGLGSKGRASLLKLYGNIHRQRSSTVDQSTGTSDSGSSCSSLSYIPSRTQIGIKRAKVKLVSRGIQTGDLEIVSNGTRKNTRDVGTTFPSPHPDLQNQHPQLQHSIIKKTSQRRPQEHHPHGVSWFVPAEQLVCKENKPGSVCVPAPSVVWFESYSRTQLWRKPLKEKNQEQNETFPDRAVTGNSAETHVKPSKLQLTLQDALSQRRPEFVSRSRERVMRLFLQREERRLQTEFSREKQMLFNPHTLTRRNTHSIPVPATVRRAVPKSEMLQRSKQMYEQLPEVRRRKEEERRKAEYLSYRLNAQLFNKKVTNHVLGRRTPWQ